MPPTRPRRPQVVEICTRQASPCGVTVYSVTRVEPVLPCRLVYHAVPERLPATAITPEDYRHGRVHNPLRTT